MNTIYIVTGCYACYEDWDYWIEKAFTNKADAQLYAAKATELVFKCQLIRNNWWLIDTGKKPKPLSFTELFAQEIAK